MMRGLLSNEEEIARGILVAHFPLLLRLLFFSECTKCYSESYSIFSFQVKTSIFLTKRSRKKVVKIVLMQ